MPGAARRHPPRFLPLIGTGTRRRRGKQLVRSPAASRGGARWALGFERARLAGCRRERCGAPRRDAVFKTTPCDCRLRVAHAVNERGAQALLLPRGGTAARNRLMAGDASRDGCGGRPPRRGGGDACCRRGIVFMIPRGVKILNLRRLMAGLSTHNLILVLSAVHKSTRVPRGSVRL